MSNDLTKIGYCGDNCAQCPRYEATLSNNQEKLNAIRQLWIQFKWRNESITIEELKCNGCSSQKQCSYPALKNCAISKNLANCGLCMDFPCNLSKDTFNRSNHVEKEIKDKSTIEEFDEIKKAFLKKQEYLSEIKKKNTA